MKVREISGYALLALGAILLAELFLPIHLPLAGTACAVLLVWAGACLTAGRRLAFGMDSEQDERPAGAPQVRQCVLRRETLDLTDTAHLPEYLQLRAFLGSVTVRLPVDAQVTVVREGLACLIESPDGSATLLGRERTRCGSRDESAPRLYVEACAVLGAVRFTLG